MIVSVPNGRSPFIRIDDLGFSVKNAVTGSLPGGVRKWLKKEVLGRDDRPYFSHRKHRYTPTAVSAQLNEMGFQITRDGYHTYGFGLLGGLNANARLDSYLGSRSSQHNSLERTGWTYIMKATRLPQP